MKREEYYWPDSCFKHLHHIVVVKADMVNDKLNRSLKLTGVAHHLSQWHKHVSGIVD